MDITKWFGKKYPHKVGITFSGGSARGYAHVGILRALTEHGIEPGIISGTSMGAVVGVLYAAGYTPSEIQEILVRETFSKVTGFAWQTTGLLKMQKLRPVLKKYIADDFAGLKKPLFVGISNLNEARRELRSEGPMHEYLIASCSVPGIFAPVSIDGNSYVDGGLMCNLPAYAIREQCKLLIGAHVNYPGRTKSFTGPKGILERAVNLGITQNAKPEMKYCDYLIDPTEMQNYSLFDFSKIEDIIEAGYTHTLDMIRSGELPVKKLAK